MKKNILILSLVCIALLITSCNDSLEQSSPVVASPADVKPDPSPQFVSFDKNPFGKFIRERDITRQSNQDSIFKQELNINDFESELSQISLARLEEIRVLIQNVNVAQTALLFVTKELSVEELVLFYISRIKKYASYKTVIQINPDAVKIAREKDRLLSNGQADGVLFGIPVLLKDNIATKGMRTTAGAAAFKDLVIDKDAPIVENLKKHGAIILAKANLSELSAFMSSTAPTGYSTTGGHTQNAYGNFHVGGSSSGPASGVALGLASVAVGTETAGSIIYPSGQNSVFGLRPTQGSLNNSLIFPIYEKLDTPGPITRNAKDLEILYHALGDTPLDNGYKKFIANVSSLKIGLVSNKVFDTDAALFGDIVQRITTQGISVKETIYSDNPELPSLNISFLYSGMHRDFDKFVSTIKPISNSSIDSLKDFVSYLDVDKQRALYGFDLLVTSLKSDQNKFSDSNFDFLSKDVQDNITKHFIDNNVDLLFTSSNLLATDYNVAGFPALSFPVGYRSNGEPVGLTIVAQKGQDDLLLHFANFVSNSINKRLNLLSTLK